MILLIAVSTVWPLPVCRDMMRVVANDTLPHYKKKGLGQAHLRSFRFVFRIIFAAAFSPAIFCALTKCAAYQHSTSATPLLLNGSGITGCGPAPLFVIAKGRFKFHPLPLYVYLVQSKGELSQYADDFLAINKMKPMLRVVHGFQNK